MCAGAYSHTLTACRVEDSWCGVVALVRLKDDVEGADDREDKVSDKVNERTV